MSPLRYELPIWYVCDFHMARIIHSFHKEGYRKNFKILTPWMQITVTMSINDGSILYPPVTLGKKKGQALLFYLTHPGKKINRKRPSVIA